MSKGTLNVHPVNSKFMHHADRDHDRHSSVSSGPPSSSQELSFVSIFLIHTSLELIFALTHIGRCHSDSGRS
jgi:hypothetical protein